MTVAYFSTHNSLMSHEPYKPLSAELLKVLRVVADAELATTGTIARHSGGSANGPLMALRERGYVSEQPGRQTNGVPTIMYSLSVKGKSALKESEGLGAPYIEPIPALATSSSSPPTATYDGVEMRPYAGRPGALNAFHYPSRIGDRLYHRDGSVTTISTSK
jgi:hypothetical protein